MSLIHDVQFYADQSETMSVGTNLMCLITQCMMHLQISHTQSLTVT